MLLWREDLNPASSANHFSAPPVRNPALPPAQPVVGSGGGVGGVQDHTSLPVLGFLPSRPLPTSQSWPPAHCHVERAATSTAAALFAPGVVSASICFYGIYFPPFYPPPPPLLGERLLISISPHHSSLLRRRGCHRIPTKTPFSEPQCQIHSSAFLGDFFFLWGWDILLFGFIGEGGLGSEPPLGAGAPLLCINPYPRAALGFISIAR